MTQAVTQLFSDALQLPDDLRASLAAQLIDSLEPLADAAVEQAWEQEIQSRLDEIRSGKVAPVSWVEARDQILKDGDDTEAD